MKPTVKLLLLAGTAVLWSATALAKLPAPSDEAKAKAAEAAAKTAWAGKVDGYLLCKVLIVTWLWGLCGRRKQLQSRLGRRR